MGPAKRKPQGSYEVGFGKPPVHSRFKKGQSGNPRGRPRRRPATIHDMLLQEAHRKIMVREGDKSTPMLMIQAVIRKALATAASGNATALRHLIALLQSAESERHSDNDNQVNEAGKVITDMDRARAVAHLLYEVGLREQEGQAAEASAAGD
jgi:Family of unknown function (DUF5681)